MEKLKGKQFYPQEKCPSCMVGESTLEDYPELLQPATQPLERVHLDLYSSSIISIQGYKYSAVFTDSYGGFRWQYGLKTKNENLIVAKRWFCKNCRNATSTYRKLLGMTHTSCENVWNQEGCVQIQTNWMLWIYAFEPRQERALAPCSKGAGGHQLGMGYRPQHQRIYISSWWRPRVKW
jgi:hypothetical protein